MRTGGHDAVGQVCPGGVCDEIFGDGVVESRDRGIICTATGPDCQELYPPGARVTLTRNFLSSTVVFQGWGGDCSGFGALPTLTLVMNADRRCTAGFTR